ncbi:MAG: hypothetical protein [Microvirus sp.]|nr:MAG: hypothetical protein [Microvirus sp.]
MSLTNLLGRFSRKSTSETNSGIPVAVAPQAQRPLTIQEMVQKYIREAVSSQAVDDGQESFEDADDFEEDDPDTIPITHHQVVAMDDNELRSIAASYGIVLSDPPGSSGAPEATAVGTSVTPRPGSDANTKE